MTILITAKDVGKDAFNAKGIRWKIHVMEHGDVCDKFRCYVGSLVAWFDENGENDIHLPLIRFADAPEQQPPETETIFYDSIGWPEIKGKLARAVRTDLAGQSFTYELRRK